MCSLLHKDNIYTVYIARVFKPSEILKKYTYCYKTQLKQTHTVNENSVKVL